MTYSCTFFKTEAIPRYQAGCVKLEIMITVQFGKTQERPGKRPIARVSPFSIFVLSNMTSFITHFGSGLDICEVTCMSHDQNVTDTIFSVTNKRLYAQTTMVANTFPTGVYDIQPFRFTIQRATMRLIDLYRTSTRYR